MTHSQAMKRAVALYGLYACIRHVPYSKHYEIAKTVGPHDDDISVMASGSSWEECFARLEGQVAR